MLGSENLRLWAKLSLFVNTYCCYYANSFSFIHLFVLKLDFQIKIQKLDFNQSNGLILPRRDYSMICGKLLKLLKRLNYLKFEFIYDHYFKFLQRYMNKRRLNITFQLTVF